MVDFTSDVLDRPLIGDRRLVRAIGQGMVIDDFPGILCTNLDPGLFGHWIAATKDGELVVPVAKSVAAGIRSSGLGRDNVFRGDDDITVFDPITVEEYGLGGLRFGDFVAIQDADATFGLHSYGGAVSVWVVVDGDSVMTRRGPGMMGLLSS